ncbi:MAG: DinB family protein, partial [Candidatus Acidoferrales bacterium]
MPRKKKKTTRGKKKAATKRADNDRALREHLLKDLDAEAAHVGFEKIVDDWPVELRGQKPAGAAHTPWQLLEHLRIAQGDILDFCRNPNYRELEFPAGYWPPSEAPPGESAWEESIKAFRADLEEMKKLVADPKTDLFARIP